MLRALALLTVFTSVLGFGYVIDPKVPADVKQQLVNDLAFIDSIEGLKSSPLHTQIFGGVKGKLYTKFFEERVTHIGMSTCGGNAKAVACVIPLLGSSKIWLTNNYVKFSHPLMAKMMVVFHEARHTEVKHGNWPHATCPTPFIDPKTGKEKVSIFTGATLAGEPACDTTALGSYGSSQLMIKNIEKYCTNCTAKVKQDAQLYGDDQLGRMLGDGKTAIEKDLVARR